MQELIIDPEFCNLVPSLTIEEYGQLESNLIEDGCREKLVLWNGIIIDGHNRYKICMKHNIHFSIENRSFDSREDAKEWIIKNQFGRRNLTPFQRAELALKLKEIFAEWAKKKQSTHTEQGYQKSGEAVCTDKELAKLAGVSHDTIHKVETIQQEAPEPVKELAKNNVLSINKAYEATKALENTMDEEKQEVVRDISERGKTAVIEFMQKKTGEEDTEDKAEEIQDKVIDTLKKINKISIDEETLRLWLSDMTRVDMEMELEDIEDAIGKLTRMKNYIYLRLGCRPGKKE